MAGTFFATLFTVGIVITGQECSPGSALLAPVVDAERVVGALQWMMREMDNRYHKFARCGARNIVDYNTRQVSKAEKKLPYLVVVIDELADLMMLAPDETERTITRLLVSMEEKAAIGLPQSNTQVCQT